MGEAGLPARFGIEVLSGFKGPDGIRKLAHPDLKLEAGDRVVIMAEASSLQQFRQEGKTT